MKNSEWMPIAKKLFCYALLIALITFSVSTCFAQTVVYNFESITAADTVTHEIEFQTSFQVQAYYAPQTVYIQVDSANTGTVKFAVALTGTPLPIRSRFKAYGAGARIPVTIRNGLYNLFYKASASGNKFSLTN